MKGPLYLCADIGGTQIKTGLLDGAGRLVGAIHREDAQAGLPQQPLLDHIAACLLAPWPGEVPVAGVCLAMPGPCDYPAGRCWIEGLEKYGSLYGADLRRELGARLAPALGPAGENLLFQNDVAAFALGELRCGCAQGVQRGLFVCIGTGCGSAFTVGDALAPEGTPGVPPQGYLYPLPLAGKRVDDWLSRRGLLVWNGEHYNLGNVLGLTPDRHTNGMTANFFGDVPAPESDVEALHQSVESYLTLCEENGYPYDFIIASVSGLFHDNAPPNLEILHRIEAYNQRYPQGVQLRMVSLQELYSAIREPLADSPVYHGDLTDWWANGVGSTPYAVKHYREAQRRYALARRLEPQLGEKDPVLCRAAEDNLLLYAEHTWGHSSTITNPYDTMVLNLDARKSSYASKAHEAASQLLGRAAAEKGDILRYYNTSGKLRVIAPNRAQGLQAVEFYLENWDLPRARIVREDGVELPCQVSAHPRGKRLTFLDDFSQASQREYTFQPLPALGDALNSRKCYVGAERVRDIVNDYDTFTYRLPYGFENHWFRLEYRQGEGVTALVEKRTGRDLLGEGAAPFFTPLYEVTPLTAQDRATPCPEESARRAIGRNIRGQQARLSVGQLEQVLCVEHGEVFTELRLCFRLPGTVKADVLVKFYEALPRVDFRLQLGKTLSSEIESVFLPMSLSLDGGQSLYLKKGGEAFRPGVDQLPGTCMEYSMSDDGLAYVCPQGSALIALYDVPLFYFGEMAHHPIRLCDNREENNRRPVCSWVMNNTWETNFKMDLSGFGEYRYTLWLSGETDPQRAMEELRERCFEPWPLITG